MYSGPFPPPARDVMLIQPSSSGAERWQTAPSALTGGGVAGVMETVGASNSLSVSRGKKSVTGRGSPFLLSRRKKLRCRSGRSLRDRRGLHSRLRRKEIRRRGLHCIRHHRADGGSGHLQRVHAKGSSRPQDNGLDGLAPPCRHRGRVRPKVDVKRRPRPGRFGMYRRSRLLGSSGLRGGSISLLGDLTAPAQHPGHPVGHPHMKAIPAGFRQIRTAGHTPAAPALPVSCSSACCASRASRSAWRSSARWAWRLRPSA